MPFTFRKSFRINRFLRFNVGRRSTSWTLKLGPLSRTWSSTGRRSTSVDLPGPVNYRHTDRRRTH